jgi:hypothetical protein
VGGGVGDTVETIRRQCGHLILRLLPSRGVPGIRGEDDERLTVQVGQRRRLLRRRVRLDELLDEAAEVAGGRGVGARLAAEVSRETAVGGLGEQPSGTQVSHCG